MNIEPLDPARASEVAGVFARAFDADPLYRSILPDPTTRVPRLAWMFERWIRVIAPLGPCLTTSDRLAAALWLPPEISPNVPLWAQLRAGLGGTLLRIPIGRWSRIMNIQRDLEQRHRAMARPHWQLDALAVDPSRQRAGHGSALVRAMLERADHERIPTYVITHNPANLPFYERFGFRVVQQRTPGSGDFFACTLFRETP